MKTMRGLRRGGTTNKKKRELENETNEYRETKRGEKKRRDLR